MGLFTMGLTIFTCWTVLSGEQIGAIYSPLEPTEPEKAWVRQRSSTLRTKLRRKWPQQLGEKG